MGYIAVKMLQEAFPKVCLLDSIGMVQRYRKRSLDLPKPSWHKRWGTGKDLLIIE